MVDGVCGQLSRDCNSALFLRLFASRLSELSLVDGIAALAFRFFVELLPAFLFAPLFAAAGNDELSLQGGRISFFRHAGLNEPSLRIVQIRSAQQEAAVAPLPVPLAGTHIQTRVGAYPVQISIQCPDQGAEGLFEGFPSV